MKHKIIIASSAEGLEKARLHKRGKSFEEHRMSVLPTRDYIINYNTYITFYKALSERNEVVIIDLSALTEDCQKQFYEGVGNRLENVVDNVQVIFTH